MLNSKVKDSTRMFQTILLNVLIFAKMISDCAYVKVVLKNVINAGTYKIYGIYKFI